jgi:hypothetical protein
MGNAPTAPAIASATAPTTNPAAMSATGGTCSVADSPIA